MTSGAALGRATGLRRALLYGTCAALGVAAAADAATGYDGPGPFVATSAAALVALVPWRWTPVPVAVMSALFIVGGLADATFAARLVDPGNGLEFAAGWAQMLAFLVAAACALAAPFAAVHATAAPADR